MCVLSTQKNRKRRRQFNMRPVLWRKTLCFRLFCFGKNVWQFGCAATSQLKRRTGSRGRTYIIRRARKQKGVPHRLRGAGHRKIFICFIMFGNPAREARGGSLPFFVRMFFIIHLPNLGVSIIDTPNFGSSSLFSYDGNYVPSFPKPACEARGLRPFSAQAKG